MTRVLAIANAKGGVGKTTTTINLAASLAERQRRVLVVDLDPQASLTLSLGVRGHEDVQSIYQALSATAVPLAAMVRTTPEGFDLIPANHELNQAVDVLENESGRLFAVRAVLEPVRDRYDYVLLDCPANAGILTRSALAAADEVLIPLAVDPLAFQSLGWFLTIIRQVQAKVNPGLRITGLFFTMFDPRTRHARSIMDTARETYASEIPFFATSIKYSTKFRDASLAGQSMLRYEPRSAPSLSYQSLAQELEQGLGVTPENEIYFAMTRADEALAQRDRATAYAHYCRATELDPQLARAWMGRAESAPDWWEKVRSYCRALPLTPEGEVARAGLTRCLESEPMSSVGIHPLMTSAQLMESVGENALAGQVYARVTEMDPNHEQAWLGKARTASDVRDTIRYVQKCLEINPRSPLAQADLRSAQARAAAESKQLVERGIADARLGRKQSANALFEQACDLNPENDRAWVERARVAQDYTVARSYAKRALEINPKNSEARELSTFLYSPTGATAPPVSETLGLVLPLVIILILVLVILVVIWQVRPF